MDLLSQEGAFNQAIAAERRAGLQEGRKEAKREMKQHALSLIKAGKISLSDIPLFFPNFSEDDVKELEKMLAENLSL